MATTLATEMAAEEKAVHVYSELMKAKTAEVDSLTEALDAAGERLEARVVGAHKVVHPVAERVHLDVDRVPDARDHGWAPKGHALVCQHALAHRQRVLAGEPRRQLREPLLEQRQQRVVGRADDVVIFDILISIKIASSVASFEKWQMSWNNDARQTKSSPELLFQA